MAPRRLRALPAQGPGRSAASSPGSSRETSRTGPTSLTGRSHPRDVNHKLREALDDLPERSRLAISLKYFGGASYEEIARILETTPKAVESLLVRTRRELAERLRHLRSS